MAPRARRYLDMLIAAETATGDELRRLGRESLVLACMLADHEMEAVTRALRRRDGG